MPRRGQRFFTRDGRFFVNIEGPDGELSDFELTYTFGVEPLQQYPARFPAGRLQSLTIELASDVTTPASVRATTLEHLRQYGPLTLQAIERATRIQWSEPPAEDKDEAPPRASVVGRKD